MFELVKKSIMRMLFLAAFPALLAVGAAGADDADKKSKKQLKSEKRLEKIMKEYAYTGEVKSCVNSRNLRHSRVIDDKTIFFEGLGKKAYMVNLRSRCPRLAVEDRFAYEISIGLLCRTDIITVLDTYGREWGSCGMGSFKEMRRIPKKDRAEKDDGSRD